MHVCLSCPSCLQLILSQGLNLVLRNQVLAKLEGATARKISHYCTSITYLCFYNLAEDGIEPQNQLSYKRS